MFDFSEHIVIVTGGTRGIGRAISEAFLKSGAKVIVTYNSNNDQAGQFMKENEGFRSSIDLQKFDVSNYDQVKFFYDYIDKQYDSVDILVNNAGIRSDSILGTMPKETWHLVIDTNLTGTFYMSKFAVKNMVKKRYGRIINITSPMSHLGSRGQSNYAASKAGQIAMARSLSKEVASRGITVNCISPGFVSTDFIHNLDESLLNEYKKMIPMKDFSTPEQIAYGVLFLASKGASYITGATLSIDGGL